MNLDDIFKQIQKDVLEDFQEDLKEDLQEAFRSSEAKLSADKINKLFSQNEIDLVPDPSEIADQIEKDSGDLVIKLDENQRKFVAADPIYGKDAIGLKYTDN